MSGRLPALLGAVAVWLVLAAGPGLLVAHGTIGTIDAEGNVSGAVFLAWLLGFLAAYAWLVVVDLAAGRTHHWWLVTGAILPWLVDFSTAFSPRAGAVLVAVTAGNAVAVAVLALRGAWVDHGTAETATVVKVLPPLLGMNLVVNSVYLHRRVLLDVPQPDGTIARRTLGMLCEIGTAPAVGDTLPVVVDPHHPDRIALARTVEA